MTNTAIDSAATVYQAFKISAEQWADHAFLHIPASASKAYASGPVDLSYAQALQSVDELQAQYQAAGYGAGHRVALLLENRAAAFLHWFALNGLGVSVVPINGEMSAEEMAYMLEHSESCLGIAVAEKRANLEAAMDLIEADIPVLAETELSQLPSPKQPAQNVGLSNQTECTLLYTSGSTGKPKGCIINNEYVLNAGKWYRDLGGYCALTPGSERLITPLPMVHMNAMVASTMGMIFSGGCVIQLDRFHASSWWQSVRESNATVLHYLGVMPAILLTAPESPADDFSQQIKFAFGAGINPTHHAPFEQRFGFPLIEAWAMTESGVAGCVIANQDPRHVGTSCVGTPESRIEIKLVDEIGNEVAAGEPGELLVRGAGDNPWSGFFSGYLKNEAETNAALADGWLHTGDVVSIWEDGTVHFVDRRKNVIRRSGENISALEVEAVLSEFDGIDQVVVTPVPDEIRGDEVLAAVILKPGMEPSADLAEQIFEHSYEAMVYFKTPGYIAFVSEIPLTASGKPQRAEIKTQAREWLLQASCFNLCHLKKKNRSVKAVS